MKWDSLFPEFDFVGWNFGNLRYTSFLLDMVRVRHGDFCRYMTKEEIIDQNVVKYDNVKTKETRIEKDPFESE